jgi:DNA-binding HxlR family transcriptional regulator
MNDNDVSSRLQLDLRTAAVESKFTLECPVRGVIDGIRGKWDLFLLSALGVREHRFGELRRLLPDISQRMLTQTLLNLQRDGYVHREVLPTHPPSAEYSLTPLGTSLFDEVLGLLQWAKLNHNAVHEARAAFNLVSSRTSNGVDTA